MATTTMANGKVQVGGFAGWAIKLFQQGRANAAARSQEREMALIETLSLGGRKQLALVSVAGQKFLVGTSAEGVDSIALVPEEKTEVVKRSAWQAGL